MWWWTTDMSPFFWFTKLRYNHVNISGKMMRLYYPQFRRISSWWISNMWGLYLIKMRGRRQAYEPWLIEDIPDISLQPLLASAGYEERSIKSVACFLWFSQQLLIKSRSVTKAIWALAYSRYSWHFPAAATRKRWIWGEIDQERSLFSVVFPAVADKIAFSDKSHMSLSL
jgi:hypothetical protein